MVEITRQLVLWTTCVASLLGALSFTELGGGNAQQQKATVLPEFETLAADTLPSSPPSSLPLPRGPQEQCTIVELHNRKGCLYQPKSILPLDIDFVIPTPSSSSSSSSSSTSTTTTTGLQQQRKAGQPFGPPQTHAWLDGYRVTSSEALDLQLLMDCRSSGYGGADVATSFLSPPFQNDQGKPHSLWLLGDTFLGQMEKGGREGGRKRVPGYFVHNSVALVPVWEAPGEEANQEEVVFWHGLSSSPPSSSSSSSSSEEGGRERGGPGCPASLFRVASEKERKDENECHEEGEYLWPVSGVGADLSNRSSSSSSNDSYASYLILLATRWSYLPWIETDVNLTRSIFNFQVLGTTIIVVDNAHLPPSEWSYRLKHLPFTNSTENWFQAMALAREEVEGQGDGGREGGREGGFVARGEEEVVYLMGTTSSSREGGKEGGPRQILGRIPVKGLLDLSLDGMEVWGSSSKSSSSSDEATAAAAAPPPPLPTVVEKYSNTTQPPPSPSSFWAPLSLYTNTTSSSSSPPSSLPSSSFVPSPLLSPVYTGISLHFHPYLQKWYSISINWIEKAALLQSSRLITGPWDSTPIYTLPPPFNNHTLMAYTGKAHPELATKENEIVFTYVANTPGVVYPLFEEGADVLYVPRFVRVVFEKEEGGKEEEAGKRGLRTRRRRKSRERREREKKHHHSGGVVEGGKEEVVVEKVEEVKEQEGGKQEEKGGMEGGKRALRTRRRRKSKERKEKKHHHAGEVAPSP